jgi:NitT/TauT family transport system substrate-binding protein
MATNTLGVLYLLERGNTINSIEDLRGKTIYMSGVGSTPEYILRYVLEQNGLDPDADVTIEPVADHDTLVTKFVLNESSIAVLPEPKVTVALTQLAKAAQGN